LLKKSITYTDFNGDEVTEDFYFNLTKAELIEIEMAHEGGLSESLKKIVKSEDGAKIMAEFKYIILMAYGERSLDGKRFSKSQHLREQFESTEAYSELFVSLVTDPEAAAEFVQGVMPKDLMDQAQMVMELENQEPEQPAEEPQSIYNPPEKVRMITQAEAEEMDAAQLQAGLVSGALQIAPEIH
jgi:hypothetical protein